MIDRFFGITRAGSSVPRELLGGVTTFLAMAYIVVLNPAILSGHAAGGVATGIDVAAATVATCLAAAVACLVMGLLGRYPVAAAPAMGENFYFVLVAIPAAAALGTGQPWAVALGGVFLAGLAFVVLAIFGLHRMVIDAVGPGLLAGIAAGIGLFIAVLGLRNAGIVVIGADGFDLGRALGSPDWLVFGVGLAVTGALALRRNPLAIVAGIGAALLVALVAGRVVLSGVVAAPPDPAPLLLGLDIPGALAPAFQPIVLAMLFMLILDASGTLVAVGSEAGLQREDGSLVRGREALAANGLGTTAGAILGASPVTAFVESAAGVFAGARTGLAAVVVGVLFLVALFATPLVGLVANYPPVTAAALVVVGALVASQARRVPWADLGQAIPAAIALVAIPVLGSIGDGMALALVAAPVMALLAGKGRQVHPLALVLGGLALVYLVVLRA